MIEKHVTSLEISKLIKEAGWKKETEFWWCRRINFSDEYLLLIPRHDGLKGSLDVSAPLATEILEELPAEIKYNDKFWWLNIEKLQNNFAVSHRDEDRNWINFFEDTFLPNALAKTWLYLKQNNLLPKD